MAVLMVPKVNIPAVRRDEKPEELAAEISQLMGDDLEPAVALEWRAPSVMQFRA